MLDALEQALYERRPNGDLVHHSDRGSQYMSIRYTERLAEAGIEPSVGSVGDSYDNALAETIIGLFKAEVTHRSGPWKSADAVDWETLKWVDWFNKRRLLQPIGNIPPAEAEEKFYELNNELDKVALKKSNKPPGNPGRLETVLRSGESMVGISMHFVVMYVAEGNEVFYRI